jgi:uncharacterized protein (TIGR02145 family)
VSILFSEFKDPRDGNVYRTVKIGNQVWMAENLRYNIEGSCCYDNDEANCQKYGRLYTWEAAKKACPTGWHLPIREEWDVLSDFAVDGRKEINLENDNDTSYCWPGAGTKLKSRTGWYEDYGNGTDEYDFSALPGGNCGADGNFYSGGNYGYWWTATEYGSDRAYGRSMYFDEDYISEGDGNKGNGFSVRCVKD